MVLLALAMAMSTLWFKFVLPYVCIDVLHPILANEISGTTETLVFEFHSFISFCAPPPPGF